MAAANWSMEMFLFLERDRRHVKLRQDVSTATVRPPLAFMDWRNDSNFRKLLSQSVGLMVLFDLPDLVRSLDSSPFEGARCVRYFGACLLATSRSATSVLTKLVMNQHHVHQQPCTNDLPTCTPLPAVHVYEHEPNVKKNARRLPFSILSRVEDPQ